MNREELLEKSRKDKNLGLYESEISTKAGNIASVVAITVATVFYVLQIFLGLGQNYGLYAVVASVPAVGHLIMGIKFKNRRSLIGGLLYLVVALGCSVIHIINLFEASTIL